jgi:hypothetical protein
MKTIMNNTSAGWMAVIFLAGGLAGMAFGAEKPAANAPAAETPKTDIWEDHLMHPFDAIVLTEQQIDRFLARLSQTNAERAGELEKMRITNPQQFRWEIREEMANRFFQSTRQPAAADTKPAPSAPPAAVPAPPSEAVQKRHGELIVWLEKNFPRQAGELKANPSPSAERITELLNRYDPVMRAERSNPPLAEVMIEDIKTQIRCDELLMDLPYANPEEREAIIKELDELTAKRFDLIVRKRELQHELLRRRLNRLQQELDTQKQEMDLLKSAKEPSVKQRVKELVERTDKTNWN